MHSLESTIQNCGLIGPPASLGDTSSVLRLSLPSVKSPLHSPDLAVLARRKTVRPSENIQSNLAISNTEYNEPPLYQAVFYFP